MPQVERLHADDSSNLAPVLADILDEKLCRTFPDADGVAYIAGVVAHPGCTAQFAEDLHTPGVRAPITADANLWDRAVELGRQVVWAQTFGEAFVDEAAGRPAGDVTYPKGDPVSPGT